MSCGGDRQSQLQARRGMSLDPWWMTRRQAQRSGQDWSRSLTSAIAAVRSEQRGRGNLTACGIGSMGRFKRSLTADRDACTISRELSHYRGFMEHRLRDCADTEVQWR